MNDTFGKCFTCGFITSIITDNQLMYCDEHYEEAKKKGIVVEAFIYKCRDCGITFQITHELSDDARPVCNECFKKYIHN